MQEWEYKVLNVPMLGGNIEPAINELGAEGWELVLLVREHGAFSSSNVPNPSDTLLRHRLK